MNSFLEKYQSKLILALVASIAVFLGVRVIPGAVVTPAFAVAQIQASLARQDSLRTAHDSAVEKFHRDITARVDSTNRRVDLDSELLRAMARKECAELGRQKAESYGFPCHETVFHLPSP